MMHAYNSMYLDDAMDNLGEAFDYAVHSCRLNLDEFMDIFIMEGLAEQFGNGCPQYVAGISGTELVLSVMNEAGKSMPVSEVITDYECSPEYWCGWILAYYQWYTGYSFKKIKKFLSPYDILRLYPALHEASEDKCVEVIHMLVHKQRDITQLQSLRRMLGYSQRMLAEKSGVSLRMIQQYEQRAKDINRAAGMNLLALAQALQCRIEDLLEETDENKEAFPWNRY